MLIMSMITYRIVRHEVQLPINQNYDKILKRKKTSVISFHKKAAVNSAKYTTTVHAHDEYCPFMQA